MSEFGLTSAGFTKKRLNDLKTELQEAFIQTFGAGFIVTDDSVAGKQIGIMADRLSEIWEGLEAIYFSQYPDTAGGVSLDFVAGITGHARQIALKSTVTGYVAGASGTIILEGSVVSVVQTGKRFVTLADVTLSHDPLSVSSLTRSGSTATATSNGHGYSDNDYVFISGADQSEYNGFFQITNVTSNTFDYTVSGTPDTTATGTINVTKADSVNCESQDYGAIQALAKTLTVIDTPISGWNFVSNAVDATLGRLVETDSDFRARRKSTLNQLAGGHLEAIRSALLDVAGVITATVFENVTDATDGQGRPPHSVEALVQGGTDSDIRDSLFENVSAGIQTWGNVSGSVVDSQGISHTILFSRVTVIELYIIVDITTNSDPDEGPVYPVDGDDQIKAKLVEFGDGLKTGNDVYPATQLLGAVLQVPGILTLTIQADSYDPPDSSDVILIDVDEIAEIDSSRITINVS